MKWVRLDETWYYFHGHVAAHGQVRHGKAGRHRAEHRARHAGDRLLGGEISDPAFGQIRQGLDLVGSERGVG